MLRNDYKKGIIFGYLCWGRAENQHLLTMQPARFVYRFGKTTKTKLEGERKVHIERLGSAFGGMNKPEVVVLWEEVNRLDLAWDITKEYLRNHLFVPTKTERPMFKHEVRFGDNFFSLETQHARPQSPDEVQKHMEEAFAIVLATCRKF